MNHFPQKFVNIFKFIKSAFQSGKDRPTVVTFTGGMGAQILSAAIYFAIRNTGRPVYADLSYFDKPESIAIVGSVGDCSHFSWQLDSFGLFPKLFDAPLNLYKTTVLHDGFKKLELGLKALTQPEIQKFFNITNGISDILPQEYTENFLCIHIRRGDYVNVASHLVEDREFTALAQRFSGLIKNVVVLSDSPIGFEFRKSIKKHFKKTLFLDNTDAYTAHRIMRNARILVCSNSQFSLIAALLNQNALVFVPSKWFGGKDRIFEALIHARCFFQVMDNSAN